MSKLYACLGTIQYDQCFVLENRQASCQFNLARELKEQTILNKAETREMEQIAVYKNHDRLWEPVR